MSEYSGIDTRTGVVEFLSSSLAMNTQTLGQDLHQNIPSVPTENWDLSGNLSVLPHPPKNIYLQAKLSTQIFNIKYLTLLFKLYYG